MSGNAARYTSGGGHSPNAGAIPAVRYIRRVLQLVLTAASALLITSCVQLPPAPIAPLRALGAQHRLLIGASVDEAVFQRDAHYREVLAREFSILTPENALKFERVHPAPDRYDFRPADTLMDFAASHHMAVHGHTLVWDGQLPQWLEQGHFSKARLTAILRDHIHTVVGHYRGRIPLWDVVSEAVDDDGKLRDTFWLRGIGPDYIALAFKWAHEADPHARLLYNDYGIAGDNRKADAVFR